MEPNFYRPTVQASLEQDSAEILANFKEIIKSGSGTRVKLVNYYKGLPISYPATLVEVSGQVLELDVHPQQAVALGLSGRTCIKCGAFSHTLLADVKDADVRRMTASLHNFSYVDLMVEQRASLRLELDPPCEAEITVSGRKVAARALDVSLGGFSALTPQPTQLGKGDEVLLKVMMPNLLHNTVAPLEVPATVVDVAGCDAGELCRFSISSDSQAEGVLSRFIFQRQVDLIRELKEMSG
ncbi:PilZ domain-containing protein [Geomonas nitrogeniifigens]|uniref:PilZ domain-containing protein n=1 Tax=Geomonas diazotrophica TaxID=2843197 RepID=A0ABX8JHD4_9BACT|nr:PilZ domain-containing protein [Geomonas nitrogeniifigens]QWV97805.1 PilZ domain-containing protein [Geomonas nitrogeniifigens]QXE86945.1 PilZ domain-containing protein [Geomonas nitrogeniifigens]